MTTYRKQNLRLLLAVVSLMAVGCATVPPAILERETADFALVRDDALDLARRLGANRVLVVLDIDNTLLAMEQGLGSDQWYEWQKALNDQQPCGSQTVTDRFAVQGAMYFASAMRTTQDNAPSLVREIQDAGMPVIVLTSRGVNYRLQTFRELRRNGYDFRRSAIGPAAGWPENFIPGRGTRPARYEDGVFLTTGQHKGDMLLELLQRTDTDMPAAVVMADDKAENLEAVVSSFRPLGVSVRAWRYTGEDERVANFDPEASHDLWQTLEPALRKVQEQLGPDNFELPPAGRPECTE